MQNYILGIDIGTGSIKSIAVNKVGVAIAVHQIPYPTSAPQLGYSEQDPETIWQAFVDSVRHIVKVTENVPQAISFSCAMHSVIPVDDSGKAIYPMITWADTRSTDIAERIKTSINDLCEKTGTPVHAMSPLCKIIWLKENRPDIVAKTVKIISIKEYIWYQLFGVYEVDYSIASATGLFDITSFQWYDKALLLAGISADVLSQPVNTTYSRKDIHPDIASLLPIPADTICIIGGSDGCMANVGSFALSPSIAALTIGTSGAVRIASKQPIINTKAMTFNYCLDDSNYICGGPVNNGGNVVDWLLTDFLNKSTIGDTDYTLLFEQIETITAGSQGLLFLPYIHGERAPIWDGKSCGTYFGIKSLHTQPHFIRAAIEGIGYALYEVLQTIDNSTTPITQLNVSGGFIHSKTWMQLLADITGKRICLVQTEDASAMGAAFFAMQSLQWIRDVSELNKKPPVYIEPDLQKHALYQKYFSIYIQLYPQLKEAMHLLYAINELGNNVR